LNDLTERVELPKAAPCKTHLESVRVWKTVIRDRKKERGLSSKKNIC